MDESYGLSIERLVEQDAHELVARDDTVAVRAICLVHHLLKLVIAHSLTELARNMLQVLEANMVLILTEQDECLIELSIIISLAHLGGHDVQESSEIDRDLALFLLLFFAIARLLRLVQVAHELLDLFACRLEAESTKGHLQVGHLDEAVPIGVEQIEGFFNFISLLQRQLLLVALRLGLFLDAS